MILVELRPLIFVLITMALIYGFYRVAKKIIRTESTEEAIEDKKEEIEETLKFANRIPKVNKEKVKDAEKKIEGFIK